MPTTKRMPCDHEAGWEWLDIVALLFMCAEGSEGVIGSGPGRQQEKMIFSGILWMVPLPRQAVAAPRGDGSGFRSAARLNFHGFCPVIAEKPPR